MGSDDGEAGEKPVHDETVAAFCMDRTEVTVSAYAKCVADRKCTAAGNGDFCIIGKADRQKHPINCVDWNQAVAYCKSVDKRLPTEKEWEFAARGTDGRKYPWGNEPPSNQLCWNGSGSDLGKGKRLSTCEVGSFTKVKAANNLLDMAGNVWEWTYSFYTTNYQPRSNSHDKYRVLRGGGWSNDDASRVRAARRVGSTPSYRDINVGFRCARASLQ